MIVYLIGGMYVTRDSFACRSPATPLSFHLRFPVPSLPLSPPHPHPLSLLGTLQNPTAVQSVLEQNFRDMEMARHMPFANGCNGTHVVPAVPTASNTGNPNSAFSSSACGASLADAGPQERELDCRESKKRKMPGGSQGVLVGTGGGGDSAAELKKGRGGGEGQCGRRGWLPEEDERLRQVRRVVLFGWGGMASTTRRDGGGLE